MGSLILNQWIFGWLLLCISGLIVCIALKVLLICHFLEKKCCSDTPRLLSCSKEVITAKEEQLKFILFCSSFHSDAE